MRRIVTSAAAAAALSLIGCQGGGTTAADNASADASSAAAPAATAAVSAMPVDWKATDACSIIDKAEMAAVMKSEVTQTALDMASEPGPGSAGTSQCTYTLADGGKATVMTRWSPIADNSAEAIAATRAAAASSVKAFTDRPVEDVPGVGKAAFLVPGINQFNVFLDDSRMMIITLADAPAGEGKAMAVALAKKAGA